MRGSNNLRRSNMLLLVLVLMMLLYGIIYRVQSGDNKLYIFGFEIELPFIPSKEAPEDAQSTAPESAARLMQSIDELIG